MREVEVKARIRNLSELETKLKQLGAVLSDAEEQDDVIYFDGDKSFNEYQKCNFIRIRRTAGKSYLTLKRSIEDELDSLEHETAIEEPDEAESMIKELGLKFGVRVVKQRRQFKIGDINGSIDKVEILGDFIELEKLVDDGQKLEDIRTELRQKLTEFGVDQGDEVSQGYDTLVYDALN